jgi:hypothetical protein
VANEIRAALEISPALVSACRPRALELARRNKKKKQKEEIKKHGHAPNDAALLN